jgi:hypothetical protein
MTYFPKMVYFPSRWACLEYVMKNCALLESGPEFAMATMPRALNCEGDQFLPLERWWLACTLSVERISSENGAPQIDWPPLPVPVGSPVWIMKFLIFLQKKKGMRGGSPSPRPQHKKRADGISSRCRRLMRRVQGSSGTNANVA